MDIIDARDFAPKVVDLTGGLGVDVVAEASAAPCSLRQCAAWRCWDAWSVSAAWVHDRRARHGFSGLRRLSLIGVTNRTRTGEEQAKIVEGFSRDILPAIGDGRLQPLVDRVFTSPRRPRR